jgi:hypothetical protein
VSQLAELLFISHLMFSAVTKLEELKLSKDEAEALAQAGSKVSRHYAWGEMSEKTKDICLLIGTVSLVYAPKIQKVRSRVAEARAKRAAASASVPLREGQDHSPMPEETPFSEPLTGAAREDA